MLQSMDGCWHSLSSLDLHFKPARRQPLHHEPAAPGLPDLPGDISISKNKLEFVGKHLSNISQGPPGIPFPPCPQLQAAWLGGSCPHLAVPAGATALGHALDLPGQGLVHQVRQGLLTEQVGPQLHTARDLQQGTGQERRNRKSCSATTISRFHSPPLPLITGLQEPTDSTEPPELPALLPSVV